MISIIKTYIQTLLLSLMLSFSAISWANDSIQIEQAWIEKTGPQNKMYSGFLTIRNNGNDIVELLTISSKQFKKIEIHQSQVINKIARMIEQDGIALLEKETTKLQPGGLHLMMKGPSKDMQDGDKIDLTFNFEDRSPKTITATIKKRNNK